MADQYDVSAERKKVLEENAKRRTYLRNEFLKKSSDPFRQATGEGGAVFDSAIQRYISMTVSTYEHFRPTAANARFGLFYALLPILGFTYVLSSTRNANEQRYRNGEVAYKDREFKFI